MRRPVQAQRRGSVYVVVLSASVFVVGAAAAAALLARERLSGGDLDHTIRQTARHAESGVEVMWKSLEKTTGWRTLPTNTWFNVFRVGSTLVEASLDDPGDGTLSNTPYGPVKITVRATNGQVVQLRSIILEPSLTSSTDLVERPGSRRREVLP
ncbi:MAG: hypothetical protein KJZ65_01250 [Phycisphaerales bacterium]|nr:hypothetical protein [Phycisphaerales bacterium]